MRSIKVAVGLATLLSFLVLLLTIVANAQEPYSSAESGQIGEFGLANPPPAGLTVQYMFTGVANHITATTRAIATSIHCTNFGSTSLQAQLQLFSNTAGATYTSPVTINTSQTWTFSTQATVIYREDSFLNTNIIEQGSGRVLADKATLICTAQTLDPFNNPPKYMTKLPLFDRFGNLIRIGRKVYLPTVIK